MSSELIFLYYDWSDAALKVVEDLVWQRTKRPQDTTLPTDTDDVRCRGFSLKGQNIETSAFTGNVFIKVDLLTFAHWLKQYELSVKE